ncbi:aminoglycoside adenylyltransferase domain-containing protein [Streptomyces sp. NPDC001970]
MRAPAPPALVDGLLEISGSRARRGSSRPVELTVVVQSDVRPWRYPPTCEFLYGEWLRDEYERGGTPSPAPCPDLAPLITMVLMGDTPLFGPPPGEVLDPVPHEDLVRAVVAGVPALLDDLEGDTRNVVLALARIWTTLATGDIRSKDAAAAWALTRLPVEHRTAMGRARAICAGDAAEDWTDLLPDVRALADRLVAAIEESAARRSR